MRFFYLLSITSAVFLAISCNSTNNPNNNTTVTPTTQGNCRDGIQNGTEQGVDCGIGCTSQCNGNMTIIANGTTLSNGTVRLSTGDGQYLSNVSPLVYTQYSSMTLSCYFYKDGINISNKYLNALTFYYLKGGNPVGTYTLSDGGGSPTNPLLNEFTSSGIINGDGSGNCTPNSTNPGSGTLTVTSFNAATRKISGSFNAALNCSGTYNISGTFTDVGY